MKTAKKFSRGITGLFLLLILTLVVGCQDALSDYTVTETGPSLSGPTIHEPIKYTGGVLLTWELVPDAAGYQVYRYNSATGEERTLSGSTANHYYLDLVDFNNPLIPTAADKPVTYTYKVVAVSGGSGNQRAAVDSLVFNGVSSVDVTFDAADIPARNADTTSWIKLDDPKVEPRSNGLQRVVLENTTPNLKYSAKFTLGGAVDGQGGTVFKYDGSGSTFNRNPFNPTKSVDVPEFGGKTTVEVTAAYYAGEYYPATAVKTAATTQEYLPEPSNFTANTVSNTDPEYVSFGWKNDPAATGYSIYKVKGDSDSRGIYSIQGDWAAVSLKDRALDPSGNWSAVEAAGSEPGAYIYALVAEAGTKKSLPAIYEVTLYGTGLSTPSNFSVTYPAPYGLDDQYALIQWENDAHVETYTVYKAVEDPYTGKLGDWTEVVLTDKKLNKDPDGIKGTWVATEKDLPKVEATYYYKLVATAGDQRVETQTYLTTTNPANSGLSVRSLITTDEPLKVELTLGNLDSTVTYKLSRAPAAWAEGETDFTLDKAVSVGTWVAASDIKLPNYHTGDTYTFFDDAAGFSTPLAVRTSYIYKLVKEKSATEKSDPVYAALNEGAYSKASYLRITRNNNYDGVAFDITDEGTYWGDSPTLKIYRAPKDGQYGAALTSLTTMAVLDSYNDTCFFEDDRAQLINGNEYHYKFAVTLANGTVLEERNFQYNDLDGDGSNDGRRQKDYGSLYTPIDTPVTAYFAESNSPSNATFSSFTRTNALSTLVINVSGDYVINAPVTVTYTPWDNTTSDWDDDASKSSPSTVIYSNTGGKIINFTGNDIDPNVTSYRITVSRTTGTNNNPFRIDFDYTLYQPANLVDRLTVASFYATGGNPYDSIGLSLTLDRALLPATNVNDISWQGGETITVDRKVSGALDSTYAPVTTGLALSLSTNHTIARRGLDNASTGLLVTTPSTNYVYRISITGGYFGGQTYREESSASPNNYGSLGTLTVTVPATGAIGLDFNDGSNYGDAKITVQYKLGAANWTTVPELTLDVDGKASFARPAAGTYNIQYKYKNDTAYTAGSTFTVAP